MAVNLGMGVIRIAADLAPLRTALVSARYQLASFVAGTRSIGQVTGFLAGNFLVSSVITLGRAFVDANVGASHLGETMNRINVIFGQSANVITGFAEQMAKDFGYAKNQVLELAASFGQMGLGAGLSQKEAAEFGKVLGQVAVDAQSFMDVDLSVAGQKVASALAGQIRPLREWGVLLSSDQVKQEAFRLGLAKFGGAISEQDKVLARSSLMLRKLGIVEGDAARTAGSAMRQQEAAIGRLKNAFVDFGQAMSPLWQSIVTSFNSSMGNLQKLIEDNKDSIRTWAVGAAEWFDYFKSGFQKVIGTFGPLFTSFGRAISQLLLPSRKVWNEMAAGAAKFGRIFAGVAAKWIEAAHEMYRAIGTLGGELWSQFGELVKEIAPLIIFAAHAMLMFSIITMRSITAIIAKLTEMLRLLAELRLAFDIITGGGDKAIKEREKQLAKPADAAEIGKVVANAQKGANPPGAPPIPPADEGLPAGKHKKHDVMSSFEETWKKLQGGVDDTDKKQLGQLQQMNGKMDNLINAVKQRQGNGVAIAAGGN